jgi:hypothetical protein
MLTFNCEVLESTFTQIPISTSSRAKMSNIERKMIQKCIFPQFSLKDKLWYFSVGNENQQTHFSLKTTSSNSFVHQTHEKRTFLLFLFLFYFGFKLLVIYSKPYKFYAVFSTLFDETKRPLLNAD